MIGWIFFALGWLATVAAAGMAGYHWPRKKAASAPVQMPATTCESKVPEAAVSCSPDAAWEQVEASLQFHRTSAADLARSIVNGLRSTTDPLTSRLVEIRSQTAEVVSLTRSHDRKMSSGEDLEWVETLAGKVRDDMDGLSRVMHESSEVIDHHFSGLKQRLQTVYELCEQIEDVSARINLLSINASIEAARAGASGKGFKVIASEVKTLAQSTSILLAQIQTTVQSTQDQFVAVDQDLGKKKRGLSEFLGQQEQSFLEFRSQFREQRGQFETLYRRILSFVDHLDTHVQHISPLVQLHDIVVQELENLANVNDDVLGELVTVARLKAQDAQASVSDYLSVGHRAAETRKRLTTASELQILGAAMRAAGLEAQAADQTVTHVELF